MDFDLIIRNATLPDGRTGQDVAVAAGRIAAVERQIGAQAKRTIEAAAGCCPRLSSTPTSIWTRR